MKKMLQMLRYLSRSFLEMAEIAFLSVLATTALTDLIFALTDRGNTNHQVVSLTAPLEMTSGVIALLIGLLLFIDNFKVALANGVSRKTLLLANLPAAVMGAGLLSLFNQALVPLHSLVWRINIISELVYPRAGWMGLLAWQFALYLLLIVAGWCICMAYYRGSTPARWAISLAPVALFWLLQAANAGTNGAVYRAIKGFWQASMGLAGATHNAYIASVSMLMYAAAGCGLVYLLLRRAPVKG